MKVKNLLKQISNFISYWGWIQTAAEAKDPELKEALYKEAQKIYNR